MNSYTTKNDLNVNNPPQFSTRNDGFLYDQTYGFCIMPQDISKLTVISTEQLLNNGINYANTGEVNWRDFLINELIKPEDIIVFLGEISTNSKLEFVSLFENNLKANHVKNKARLKEFRVKLLLLLLDKLNYKKNIKSIVLNDKSGRELLQDIHSIAVCYTESKLNNDLLDMFIFSAENVKDKLQDDATLFHHDIKASVMANKDTINNLAEKFAEHLNNTNKSIITLTSQVFALRNQNEELLKLVKEPKVHTINETKQTNKRSRFDVSESEEDEDLIVEETNTDENNSKSVNNTVGNNLKIIKPQEVIPTTSNSVNNAANVVNTSNVTKPAKLVTYANKAATISNNHNNKRNQKVVNNKNPIQNVVIDGKNRIMHASQVHSIHQSNDGFTEVKRSVNKNRSKNIVIGSALADAKKLRAMSTPFQYFTSNWHVSTSVDDVRQYISSFAKIIDLKDVSTQNRFKSFKLTVESFCKEEILSPERWPGGVIVKRWFEPKIKKNVLVRGTARNNEYFNQNTHQMSLQSKVTNVNKTVLDNQMVNLTKNSKTRNEFLSTMSTVAKTTDIVSNNKNVKSGEELLKVPKLNTNNNEEIQSFLNNEFNSLENEALSTNDIEIEDEVPREQSPTNMCQDVYLINNQPNSSNGSSNIFVPS